ncbi:MAG TPA: glycosyl hydrolase, partial [Chitinophagaceae bacterium]
DFARKAQLVNYDQYRALIEGFSAHIWDWYTGVIIWKTQNPWTALRGQMYDYYLDPNAGLYGLHKGGEPLHVMYDPVKGMVDIVNNTFREQRNLMLQVKLINMRGESRSAGQVFEYINPSSVKSYLPIGRTVGHFTGKEGGFLLLRLMDTEKNILSENFYWLPDSTGNYSGLEHMANAELKITARYNGKGHITVAMSNPENNPVAFFNRVSLVDASTKERLLPVFYSDNYISVMPGESRAIDVDYSSLKNNSAIEIAVNGWNTPLQYLSIAP